MTNTNPSRKQPNYKLRDARRLHDWTYKNVADRIDLPDSRTVGRWERGETSPSAYYREKLCELFQMSRDDLGIQATITAKIEPIRPATQLNKLPIIFSTFIGRKQEVDAVDIQLRRPDLRLLTLNGTGGIGKTRLGIEAAAQAHEHFVDGVCFIPLAEIREPDMLVAALASALGIQDSSDFTPKQQVKNILRDMHMLLFMDNFEHLIGAATLIEELLQDCPQIKVLVTSREVLKIQAEHVFEVLPLALPNLDEMPDTDQLLQYAAVALFTQRAQEYLPTFKITETNATAIAELCLRLDGLPLAIELAAARIKLYSPQALLDKLKGDQNILKNGLRSAPERHYTLEEMIQWSYNLLSASEKWFFQHFSVFIGGAQLETIEACFSTAIQPAASMVEIVDSVLNKTLLQRVEKKENPEPRFVMLETVRHYALSCLRASGELEEQYRAYALHYLSFVEQAIPALKGTEQAQWLAKLDLEAGNLRAALRWLIEHQESELALRFSEAFGKFCGLRGYWNEERHWLKTALQLPELPGSQQRAIRAKVLRRAGHLSYRWRELADARLLLEQSVAYSREIHDLQNLAGALSSLAWVLYRQNEQEEANRLLQECLEVAYKSQDNWVLANSLESVGRFMQQRDQGEKARTLLEESIIIARRHLDKESLARILTTQVELELAQNNIQQAMSLAQESYTLAKALGTKPLIALTIDVLGNVTLFQGNYLQARELFEQRIAIAEQIGDISTVIRRQMKLAEVALALEDFAQETLMVQKTLDFLFVQGDKSGAHSALCILGDLKLADGKITEAYACYTKVLQHYKEPGDKSQVGRCLLGLARIRLYQKKSTCAAILLGAASVWIHPFKLHPQQRITFEQVQAQVSAELGESIFSELLTQGKEASLASLLHDLK